MKLSATLAAALIGTAAFAQVDLINKVKDNGADAPLGYEWETVVDIEATPVKNQGASGTCWSYATTSFVESEMIRMGKEPIDISEMFTVRKVYEDKGEKYVRRRNFFIRNSLMFIGVIFTLYCMILVPCLSYEIYT